MKRGSGVKVEPVLHHERAAAMPVLLSICRHRRRHRSSEHRHTRMQSLWTSHLGLVSQDHSTRLLLCPRDLHETSMRPRRDIHETSACLSVCLCQWYRDVSRFATQILLVHVAATCQLCVLRCSPGWCCCVKLSKLWTGCHGVLSFRIVNTDCVFQCFSTSEILPAVPDGRKIHPESFRHFSAGLPSWNNARARRQYSGVNFLVSFIAVPRHH